MTNISKNGNKTNNQDISECPSLQIKLRIQVQKRTYIILKIKTTVVFGTIQLNEPTLYEPVLPKFWNNIIKIPIIDNTKYTNEGVHKSLKFFMNAIIIYNEKKLYFHYF